MREGETSLMLLAAKLIAVAGTAIAGVLTYFHVDALVSKVTSAVPLCGGTRWLDCESVLNSRWSAIAGVPVAALGLVVWLGIAVVLVMPGWKRSGGRQAVLVAFVLLVTGAAAFYIYLQLAVLGSICSWCMADHALAILLAIIVFGGVRPKLDSARWGGAIAVGLVGTFLLVVLSVITSAGVVKPVFVPINVSTADGKWIETDDPAHAITFSDGNVVLDRRTHPIIGGPEARKYMLELVDPKCHHCAWFVPLLKAALAELGPEYGVVIGYVPSETQCNRYMQVSPPYARNSCELARLALAVWLVRPEAFEGFHEWMLTEQDTLTLDEAHRRAAGLVGAAALTKAMADPRLAQMIRRDVDLAVKMNIDVLPGLVVGNTRFGALPTEASVLALLTRQLMPEPNYQPPPGD